MKSPKERNPKGTPQNLRRGGSAVKPIPHSEVLPLKWETFCIWYVLLGKRGKAACLRAGLSASYCTHLLQLPVIQDRIKTVTQIEVAKALKAACEEVVLNTTVLDQAVVKIAQSEPHESRNYADAVEAVKVGYRALGVIQDNRGGVRVGINNQNTNSAQVGSNAYEVFEAEWLRERKDKWGQELEAKHGTEDFIEAD